MDGQGRRTTGGSNNNSSSSIAVAHHHQTPPSSPSSQILAYYIRQYLASTYNHHPSRLATTMAINQRPNPIISSSVPVVSTDPLDQDKDETTTVNTNTTLTQVQHQQQQEVEEEEEQEEEGEIEEIEFELEYYHPEDNVNDDDDVNNNIYTLTQMAVQDDQDLIESGEQDEEIQEGEEEIDHHQLYFIEEEELEEGEEDTEGDEEDEMLYQMEQDYYEEGEEEEENDTDNYYEVGEGEEYDDEEEDEEYEYQEDDEEEEEEDIDIGYGDEESDCETEEYQYEEDLQEEELEEVNETGNSSQETIMFSHHELYEFDKDDEDEHLEGDDSDVSLLRQIYSMNQQDHPVIRRYGIAGFLVYTKLNSSKIYPVESRNRFLPQLLCYYTMLNEESGYESSMKLIHFICCLPSLKEFQKLLIYNTRNELVVIKIFLDIIEHYYRHNDAPTFPNYSKFLPIIISFYKMLPNLTIRQLNKRVNRILGANSFTSVIKIMDKQSQYLNYFNNQLLSIRNLTYLNSTSDYIL